jgi:hypothetical protein
MECACWSYTILIIINSAQVIFKDGFAAEIRGKGGARVSTLRGLFVLQPSAYRMVLCIGGNDLCNSRNSPEKVTNRY